MHPTTTIRRKALTILLLALAALAIGAVFGSAHNGNATIAVKPANVRPARDLGERSGRADALLDRRHLERHGADLVHLPVGPLRRDREELRRDHGRQHQHLHGAAGGRREHASVQPDRNELRRRGSRGLERDRGRHGEPRRCTGCPTGTGTIQIGDLAPPARLAIDQQTVTPEVGHAGDRRPSRLISASPRAAAGRCRARSCTRRPSRTTSTRSRPRRPGRQRHRRPDHEPAERLPRGPRSRSCSSCSSAPGSPVTRWAAGSRARLLVSFPVSLKS